MWQLNLPLYQLKLKKQGEKYQVFDAFRNKFVALTPEEWVRQQFLWWLVDAFGYPVSRIVTEKQIDIQGNKLRFDAIVVDDYARPVMVIEFKSPEIQLSQSVFDQVAVYNSSLKVKNQILSNGLQHIFYTSDTQNRSYSYLETPPFYSELINSTNNSHEYTKLT